MRTSQPRTIYLKEYQAPRFLVDEIDLRFELFEEGARVHSRLKVRRNHESDNAEGSLVLDGEHLKLESVAIDGDSLDESRYEVTEEQLTINDVGDDFELQITTWIEPQNNTRLQGLYKSSGMFCTQCEAEGFRNITYFPDRPDVMSRYRTRIEADKSRYPVLLSNGNDVERGDLENDRHYVTWEDPFRKPSYLFALVGGDLVEIKDSFRTVSGRDIDLRMYVEPRNAKKCDHAMASLKRAMRWDEKTFGREYDLDIFMIVAVDDFNMGAMENKGLNIFNSSCVLASESTATDQAFERIESIVAHEYFHNWSGNRVTCRDWFQLSLKEGFTVFRDSEYSSDLGSRTVKRIEDVTLLRTAQFAEDAGPMAHPVRPSSYMEIANFYTLTIYEKGAEVVRMIRTLLGAELFRKGSDLYFERHDGQAVTTDDFVQAMEDASGIDLSQFRLWYEQAGTPVLTVSDEYDESAGVYRLTIAQEIPPTPGQKDKKAQHIPFALGLLDAETGKDLPLKMDADDDFAPKHRVLDVREASQTFEFQGLKHCPVPSLLRGFSAPVRLRYPWTRDQLAFLMANDSDGFNRWDAGQRLAVDVILARTSQKESKQRENKALDPQLIEAYRTFLTDDSLDKALVAKMLQLPSESYLVEVSDSADVPAICQARDEVLLGLAKALHEELIACYHANLIEGPYEVTPEAIAKRSLRNTALAWLLRIDDDEARALAEQQYSEATNMTDQAGALRALVNSSFTESRENALSDFYDRWQNDPQVVEQWLAIQSSSNQTGDLMSVKTLLKHPAFDWKNPNKIRSVIGAFANQNLSQFHLADGSGYEFLAEQIIRLDESNPQIASRLVTPLSRWRKFAPAHAQKMKAALEKIQAKPSLSKDVYEIVHKSLEE